MVSAAARTGTESRRRKEVSRIDQQKRVISFQRTRFIETRVVMKLIAPKREEKPATWSEKMR
jgi:hypothetical protein